MKQFISRRSFLKAAGAATALTAVSLGAPAASAEETNCFLGEKSAVTILYTNDVHTYIDKKSPELTYAGIAALKQSYVDAGQNVLLVDAGDHIQGTAYGSMDDGETIIKLMSEAGYDLATPGNHEFDYGMARAKAAMKEAAFPYVSCNWVDLRTGLKVLPSIKIFTIGGARIAFVGVTTPETFTKSTPAYFMNASQTKYIYDILGGDDGQKLYKAVQKAIDKAKLLGATTIIGLGHLGVDPSSAPWTSEEVIAHTTGFDAFIDGHSHTVMENKQVTDASGKAVTLTQTGSYFKNVGKMTIGADGSITTELLPSYDGADAAVAAATSEWVSAVDDMLGEEIAVGDNDTLSAIVAATVSADLLVLLSDIDGLYDGDPRKNPDAKLIPTVETVDERIIALGGGSGSSLGTGGMATKLLAAQIAVSAGCEMVIANGEKPELLYDIVAGKPIGTRFLVKR